VAPLAARTEGAVMLVEDRPPKSQQAGRDDP